MAKLLRQNVGGVDYTMAGCALTGVCPTAAANYIKEITLSDGDIIGDGMMVVVTFANGNTAGNAPDAKTIYSSDQVNYYEDDQLTVPFTLAPEGCYEIEYTGTGNAYAYIDYPVFQIGSVSGPVCDYRGHVASGDLWSAGDSVQCMLKEGKFLLLGGSGGTDIDVYDTLQDAVDDLPNLDAGQIIATEDTGAELAQPVNAVESGNLHAVTSNAVAQKLNSYDETEWTDSTTNFKFYAVKRNGIVTLVSVPRYDEYSVTSTGSPVYVGTLPDGYKPINTVRGVGQYGDSDLCAVQVEVNGKIKYGTWTTKVIKASVYMSLSFPCA